MWLSSYNLHFSQCFYLSQRLFFIYVLGKLVGTPLWEPWGIKTSILCLPEAGEVLSHTSSSRKMAPLHNLLYNPHSSLHHHLLSIAWHRALCQGFDSSAKTTKAFQKLEPIKHLIPCSKTFPARAYGEEIRKSCHCTTTLRYPGLQTTSLHTGGLRITRWQYFLLVLPDSWGGWAYSGRHLFLQKGFFFLLAHVAVYCISCEQS